MKILIVDDDAEITTVFSTALKNEGYEVITALDGNSGIEKAKTEKPDIILLDQVLPDWKGNDILKTLKEDTATKNTPIAMLSNFGQNELVQEALNNGALDYILKYQIEPEDLIKKVQTMAQEGKKSEDLHPQ